MKKRLLAAALALALCLTLLPAALAAEPKTSYNINGHKYVVDNNTIRSYLYDNGNGLTRVECVPEPWWGGDANVTVENYSADFQLLSSQTVPCELPKFGGFYLGEEYNFLICGQDNEEESNRKEVIRVVKYDKDWNRLGSVGLFGANTIHPFRGGCLRCAEYGGYLYVRTCHEMYADSQGLHHQANLTFCVREEDMKITDSFYDVMNPTYGYVSHSFNQFILVDRDKNIIAADHGDGYPRSHVLMRYPTKAGGDKFVPSSRNPTTTLDLVTFPGEIGENNTGSSLGGLTETTEGYLIAYNLDEEKSEDNRDIYMAYVNRDLELVQTVTLDCPNGASTPMMVPTGPEGGYLLWTEMKGDEDLCYTTYDAQGNLGEVTTVPGQLSDCVPIPYKDGIVWYVTKKSAPTFYTLSANGLQTYTVQQDIQQPEPEPAEVPPAQSSDQWVNVDGEKVAFAMYALIDEEGHQTNYIRVRDLATLLLGTAAQFDVGWNGQVTLTAHTPYYGSFHLAPFSGNMPYSVYNEPTVVNGKPVWLDAIQIVYDGGGYTYYKLRDLAQALDFNVGWSADKGVYVETDKSYDPAN